jgi:hypothetical protein
VKSPNRQMSHQPGVPEKVHRCHSPRNGHPAHDLAPQTGVPDKAVPQPWQPERQRAIALSYVLGGMVAGRDKR